MEDRAEGEVDDEMEVHEQGKVSEEGQVEEEGEVSKEVEAEVEWEIEIEEEAVDECGVEYAEGQLEEWNAVFGNTKIPQSLYESGPGEETKQECDDINISEDDSIMPRPHAIPSKLRVTLEDMD